MKICQWIGDHPSVFLVACFVFVFSYTEAYPKRVFPGKAMTVLLEYFELQLTVILLDLSSNTRN